MKNIGKRKFKGWEQLIWKKESKVRKIEYGEEENDEGST